MNAKKLLVAGVVTLIGAPVAAAGTDTGIGIPAPLVTEHTGGIFRASQPALFVTEKVNGQWRVSVPESPSNAFLSENTRGQSRAPVQVSAAAPVVAVPDGGFDWSDAGVGAGVMLGSLLIASAGALAIRRRGLPAH